MRLPSTITGRRLARGFLTLAAACAVSGPAWAALSGSVRVVLQLGRHYSPGDLFLHRGDSLTLVNGDANVVHHAFVDASQFAFDAGDQEPGARTVITLTTPGDFILQCGIHPKMKLTVHVE